MTTDNGSVNRRKALHIVTAAVLASGAGIALWPAIDQLNPDASVLPDELEVDLSSIKEGESATIWWHQKPVFIRHRTAVEIELARGTPLQELMDTDARIMGPQPPLSAADANRTKPGKEDWLVVLGICTREGCILTGQGRGEEKGDYQGWFCPCCAAHYDTAGRTRKGIAPRNLAVPIYRFTESGKLVIGSWPRNALSFRPGAHL